MSKGFKILLIIFVVVAVICGIVYFSVGDNTPKEETEEKTTTQVDNIKNKIPDGIKIKNENIEIADGSLNFSVTVSNTNDKKIDLTELNLIVKNEKGETISDLLIPINSTLEKNDEIQLFAQDVITTKGEAKKLIYRFETK